MRNKFLLFVLFWLGACMAWAATPSTLYYMEYLPYRTYMNPALRPACKSYVEIPAISTISGNVDLGGLTMNDVLYPVNGTLVTPLHPEFGNQEELLAKLQGDQPFDADVEVSILGFGFQAGKNGFLSFNASARVDAGIVMPEDAFNLILEGTPDLTGVNTFDLGSLYASSNAYFDVSAGYQHRINDKWSVGGRLHVLVGYANFEQRFDNLTLQASGDEWVLRGSGSMGFYVPGFQVTLDEEGHIAEVTPPTDNMAYLTDYKPNIGGAVDLGMDYRPVNGLSLSLAVKDLGAMYWFNTNKASGSIDYTYDGVDYKPGQEINYADSLQQALMDSYQYEYGGSYVRMMRAKLYAGVEYSFLKNKMSVGLLSKTEFMPHRVDEEITVSYNLRPVHWFSLTASYSFFSGGWSTLGVGLDIKLPPFNIYVVTDYLPLYYGAEGIPYRSQAVNVQAGIVLTFGCKKKPNVPYFTPTDFQ